MHLLHKSILASACIASLAACSDFLEEYSQDTYYVSSYEDLDELLIGDCYLPVQRSAELSSTSDIGFFLHYLGDEIEEQNGTRNQADYNNKERIFGYFTWQPRAGQTANNTGYYAENGTWRDTYRLINVANNIIESVDDVPHETEAEQLGTTRVDGEAHFLRAAYYFWLVNLYGVPYRPSTAMTDLGVPVKTESKVNDIIFQRNTVQEVYEQILADLQQAERDLAQTGAARSIYRADSTTVHLLMSRVYLYMQNWEMAARYADKVLAVRSRLANLNSQEGAFLTASSPEVLFSMGGAEVCTSMCNNYQSFRVSHDLYNAYDDEDLRKTQWWWTYNDFVGYVKMDWSDLYGDSYNDPTSPDYYYYNFEAPSRRRQSEVSDKFLYRTAEAYLNKAEAEACMGNDAEARSALNTLRANRYQTGADYTVNASGEELVQAIRDERFRELALEGHRWFDLRRYSVCEVYPWSKQIIHDYTYYEDVGSTNMTERHRFVLEPNDAGYTLSIPHEVLEYNVGMPDNEHPYRSYTLIPIE